MSVASTWPLLMAALRDRRLPVAERACAVLAVVVKLAGGQFLARRVHTEAWPLLAKLLTTGSAASTLQTKSLLVQERLNGAGGTPLAALEDEHMAPAAVQRAQLAALACLAVMCSDAEAAKAVKSLAWPIASAALPFLGRSASAALHEAACSLLLALAGVDADAVWLLLHDVVASGSSASGAAKRKPGAAGSLPLQPTSSPQAAGAAVLQPAERLLPPLPAAAGRPGLRVSSSSSPRGAWPVTPELAAECAARAAPLLERVNSLPSVWCTWHKR